MDPDTTLTVGLVGLIFVCLGGGIGVVIWLYGKFDQISKAMLSAVQESRKAGDEQIREVGSKIDVLSQRQQTHELHVETKFLSKETANMVFGRVEKAVDDARGDIRELIKQVSKLNGRAEQ